MSGADPTIPPPAVAARCAGCGQAVDPPEDASAPVCAACGTPAGALLRDAGEMPWVERLAIGNRMMLLAFCLRVAARSDLFSFRHLPVTELLRLLTAGAVALGAVLLTSPAPGEKPSA